MGKENQVAIDLSVLPDSQHREVKSLREDGGMNWEIQKGLRMQTVLPCVMVWCREEDRSKNAKNHKDFAGLIREIKKPDVHTDRSGNQVFLQPR